MKTLVVKVLSLVTAIVMVVVLAFGTALSPDPVQAAPAPQCILQVEGTVGIVLCADIPIAQIPLPTIQVQGPTITLPPVTLPPIVRPTQTVTVTVPGGTETVTESIPNGIQTVTVTPDDLESNTQGDTNQASSGDSQPTATATVIETGQNPPGDGTIESEDTPAVDLGDGETTVEEVGLGLLTTIALVGLLLCAMYAGYILGYKDRERKETSFMRAVLEQAKIGRGKHR